MARVLRNITPTAQRLDSPDASTQLCNPRKIMRKDKGLNGDLDRLPVLTWLMFLKFIDDLERVHADEAELAGEPFHAAIDAPYRRRDWAADKDDITGPELLAYLRCRGNNDRRDRRDFIATVFRSV